MIKGRDQYGNLASSELQSWQSSVDTRAPMISDLTVEVSNVGGVGNDKAQVIVSWHTR